MTNQGLEVLHLIAAVRLGVVDRLVGALEAAEAGVSVGRISVKPILIVMRPT